MDLSDLLECSVCLEQLSSSNKVLPCQHTFCTQCLKVGFRLFFVSTCDASVAVRSDY